MMAAGGVFTVLLSVGLIPRFAGKTHTNRKVFLYEETVVAGTIIGCILSVFEPFVMFGKEIVEQGILNAGIWEILGNILLVFYGTFAGMFVGCLALAIAEMLDSIPIFARRIGFRHGLGIAVTAMAFGKMCGSLIYFITGMYHVVE